MEGWWPLSFCDEERGDVECGLVECETLWGIRGLWGGVSIAGGFGLGLLDSECRVCLEMPL